MIRSLFINASSEEHYEKGKRQNYLRPDDVTDIVDAYRKSSNHKQIFARSFLE